MLNPITFAILNVFLVGMIIGRTPAFLGKKIEAREMRLVTLAVAGMLIVEDESDMRRFVGMALEQEGLDTCEVRMYASGSKPDLVLVDLGRHEVVRGGEPVHLTRLEFRLRAALIAARGGVIAVRQLLAEVRGIHDATGRYRQVFRPCRRWLTRRESKNSTSRKR